MKSNSEKDKPAAADAAFKEGPLPTIPMESVATLARHTALNLGSQVRELGEAFLTLGDVLPEGHPAHSHLEEARIALGELICASDNLRGVFLSPENSKARFGLVVSSAR